MKINFSCSMCTTRVIDDAIRTVYKVAKDIFEPRIYKVRGKTCGRRWTVKLNRWGEHEELTNREAYYYFCGVAEGGKLILLHNTLDARTKLKQENADLRSKLAKARDELIKEKFKSAGILS